MIILKEAIINEMSLQKVGHKLRNESNVFSSDPMVIDSLEQKELTVFFLNSMKGILDANKFCHHIDINFNVIYKSTINFFDNDINFTEYSHLVLKHLFDVSNHPLIKSGKVFIVHFEGVVFEKEISSAIGIFKLEKDKRYIKFQEGKQINFKLENGFKLESIDKGCLILNTAYQSGLKVFTIDNNQYDTEYWVNHFLGIEPINNNTYQTKKQIQLIRGFSSNILQENKKQQAEFISNSIKVLAENENFNQLLFEEKVLQPLNLINEFSSYKEKFTLENNVDLWEEFEVSKPILISQRKKIKNIIKLDTNIQINLDIEKPEAAEKFIEKGYDSEKKMHFYKVFFNNEM